MQTKRQRKQQEEEEMEAQASVPQWLPASAGQSRNNAGGYAFRVDDLQQLRRFVCLGCEGGTFYASERRLLETNVGSLRRLVEAGRGQEAVGLLREMSVEGRVARQGPLLLALALCARHPDLGTKRAAYASLRAVCRTPTHLFEFVDNCQRVSAGGSGWGRAHRRAIGEWYAGQRPRALARLATKYRSRCGWRHRDLLRLCHPRVACPQLQFVLRHCLRDRPKASQRRNDVEEPVPEDGVDQELVEFIASVERLRQLGAGEEAAAAELVRSRRLLREDVPAPLLGSPLVLRALLPDMPLGALLRSLAKLLAAGVFAASPELLKAVAGRLSNAEQVRAARLHPVQALAANRVLASGRGERGRLSWRPEPRLQSALDTCFRLSFGNLQPTGRRFLVAVDVSGSMSAPASPLSCVSCAEAAAAVAMVIARTETDARIVGFCSDLVDLGVRSDDSLDEVMRKTQRRNFGSTDCAKPMLWAARRRLPVDVFVVLTDSETWYGRVHPHQALVDYRNRMQLHGAKLAVLAMAANEFTIADPQDPGMLDLVGFDAASLQILRSFVMDEF